MPWVLESSASRLVDCTSSLGFGESMKDWRTYAAGLGWLVIAGFGCHATAIDDGPLPGMSASDLPDMSGEKGDMGSECEVPQDEDLCKQEALECGEARVKACEAEVDVECGACRMGNRECVENKCVKK